MGFMDDMKTAVYSGMPRKIELKKSMSIQELYDLLVPHESEFPVEFKLTNFLGKRITFKRHKKLEMQLLVSVKENVITVRPNIQETTVSSGNFSVRTADIKNGFGFQTELNRDAYIEDVVSKISRIVNEAGY